MRIIHAAKQIVIWVGLDRQSRTRSGERVWMTAREDAKVRLGDKFNMKKFHNYALKLGPMGLDPFAAEMKIWAGQ
jgi:uncharacterized protein (DUF885 family)